MYYISRYDPQLGQFVPLDGATFQSYEQAADALLQAFKTEPQHQYKVEYSTVRKRRSRRG